MNSASGEPAGRTREKALIAGCKSQGCPGGLMYQQPISQNSMLHQPNSQQSLPQKPIFLRGNWEFDSAGNLTAEVGHLLVQVERVARAFRVYVFRRDARVDLGTGVLLAAASETDMPHAMATARRLAAQYLPNTNAA